MYSVTAFVEYYQDPNGEYNIDRFEHLSKLFKFKAKVSVSISPSIVSEKKFALTSPDANACRAFVFVNDNFEFWRDSNNWPEIQRCTGLQVKAVYRVSKCYMDWGSPRVFLSSCLDRVYLVILFLLFWWIFAGMWLYDMCWKDQEIAQRYVEGNRVEIRVTPAPFLIWTGLRRPYSFVKSRAE